MAVEQRRRSVRPREIIPVYVLFWAHNLFLSATRNDQLGESARQAVADLELIANRHNASTSLAGVYLLKLRLIANNLADDLVHQHAFVADRKVAAREARDLGYNRAAFAKVQKGWMLTGRKLISYGGIGTSLIYMLVGLVLPHKVTKPSDQVLIAFLATCGVGLLASYGYSFYEAFRYDRFVKGYDREVAMAQGEFKRAIHDASQTALDAARVAWHDFTGEDYDFNTVTAQSLLTTLEGLIGDETQGEEALHDDVPVFEALKQAYGMVSPSVRRLLREALARRRQSAKLQDTHLP